MSTTYLQCAKNQKSSKISPNDHVKIVVLKHVGKVTDDEEDDAGDEHDHDVADQGTAKLDADFDSVVRSDLNFAHHVTFYGVLGQVSRSYIGQIFRDKGRKVGILVDDLILHLALLSIERVPFHVELTSPDCGKLLP